MTDDNDDPFANLDEDTGPTWEQRGLMFRRLSPDLDIIEAARAVMHDHWVDKIRQNVPDHMQEGLLNYIVFGIKPGGFLMALLSNDLMDTLDSADEINLRSLHRWGMVLYNYTPAECYRSPDKVREWCERGGLAFIKR